MPNKRRAYRLTPLAESDLEEIWLYTFRHWSLEQADEYHHGIMAALEGLAAGRITGQQSGTGAWMWIRACTNGNNGILFTACASDAPRS